MKRLCPTINELLAFDAVARYESITHAASALCISVSAVSKQIAGLESFLGKALLEKHGRGVVLSVAGRLYWQKIAPSLRSIESASYEVRSAVSGSGVLTLASVPTFLTKWLIPRLPSFSQQYPGVILSFSQHLAAHEDMPDHVDVAIRYGHGQWRGLVCDYIAGREFVLVASPDLLAQGSPALAAQAIPSQTLLHHEGAPSAWLQWAASHGVAERDTLSGPRFAQYSALIQAAISGLGVGLVPKVLVLDELAAGSLIIPAGGAVEVDQGHYLCFRSDRLEAPVLSAFRNWILSQVRSS
jgi:LysR family transcriptional regulator, glycine cleavage system transcriptional activator